jgi:hypothetical protein
MKRPTVWDFMKITQKTMDAFTMEKSFDTNNRPRNKLKNINKEDDPTKPGTSTSTNELNINLGATNNPRYF